MNDVKTAIKLYRQLDEMVSRIDNEAAAKTKDLKAKMDQIEAWVSAKSLEEGVDSYRTDFGTVFWKQTAYCSVADWDSAFKYIQDGQKWHLLTHGVAKAAIADEIKLTGAVPPGLDYGSRRTMHIRKPTPKGD